MRQFIDIVNEILLEDFATSKQEYFAGRKDNSLLDAAWIMPDGTLYPVLFTGHSDAYLEWLMEHDPAAYEELERYQSKDERPPREHAFQNGWIRYVFDPIMERFVASFEHSAEMTPAAAKACLRLLRSMGRFQPMVVELSKPDVTVSFSEAVEYFRKVASAA